MIVKIRLWLAIFISLSCGTSCTTVQNLPPPGSISQSENLGPIDIRTSKEVDETLFLVRVIGRSFDSWPQHLDNDATASWAIDQHLTFERLRDHAQNKNLGPEIIGALDKTTNVFKKYEEYLIEIGAANRETLARAHKEDNELFHRGITFTGSVVASGNVAVGAAAAAGTWLIHLFSQNDRSEAEKRRKEAATRSFLSYKEMIQSNVLRTAMKLATKNQWKEGEIGFENLSFKEQFGRRPRDPFIIMENAEIRQKGEKAINLFTDSREIFNAAQLVPEDSIYDQYRGLMLISACRIGSLAAHAALTEGASYTYGSVIAKESVRICRTRLRDEPDVSDRGKYELAICLNAAGLHEDALKFIKSANRQSRNADYAYDYARYASLAGSTKESLEWLEKSFRLGITDIQWSRRDPELARMRISHPAEFEDLTQVKMRGEIKYGRYYHDYQVTNNSKFALTNLSVQPSFFYKNSVMYKRLAVNRIEAGQSYTWDSVESSLFEKDLVLREFGEYDCDQKRR
jgi:tetratricopeptide (TPR) repeat protein